MNAVLNPKRVEWMIPAGLILLSFIPSAAGAVRLAQLGSGAEITPENARFFAQPLPVILHIISVTLYSLLGAFQFAPGFRRRHLRWHRRVGKLLIPAGLVVALSGLWMTQFYDLPAGDGFALYVMRQLVGWAMVLAIGMGIVTVRQRKFIEHGSWMIRAYALGLGAGTQVFTSIPMFVLADQSYELWRAVTMGAGWVINIIIAEWIIQNKSLHFVNSRRKGAKL